MARPTTSSSSVQQHYDALDGGDSGQGILAVGPHRRNLPITEAFVTAAQAEGLPRIGRRSEIGRPGVVLMQFNISPVGRRVSAAHAFLNASRDRSCPGIVTDAKVDRVIFDGLRAVGVTGSRAGQAFTLRRSSR